MYNRSTGECLVEILDQVFRILEPDREPQQVVGDAEPAWAVPIHLAPQ